MSRPGARRDDGGHLRRIERHREVKCTAHSRFALDPQAAPHEPHERGGDRQSQAGAPEAARRRPVRLPEGLENCLVFFGRNAYSCVGDAEVQLGRAFGL